MESIFAYLPVETVIKEQSDQVRVLLHWLNNKEPQKLALIMEGLTLEHRPTFNKNYITPALEANFIVMTEPDSPRSPKQKYSITKIGEQFVEKDRGDKS